LTWTPPPTTAIRSGWRYGYFASDDEPFDAWRTNDFSVPAAGLPDGALIRAVDDLDALMRAMRAGTIVRPDTLALMTAPESRRATTWSSTATASSSWSRTAR
jgi:hypothetical protein